MKHFGLEEQAMHQFTFGQELGATVPVGVGS